MKQRRLLLAAALVLALLLSACSAQPAAKGGPFATLTDVLGRQVTIEKQPEKIVSLTPTNTEIVCALGLRDKLVAADTYSDYPADVQNLPKIGDYSQINVEAVAAMEPDLVLAGDQLQQEAIDALEQLGLCVVATEAKTIDGVKDSMTLVGQATGAAKEAEAAVKDYEAAIAAVTEKIAASGETAKPRVYWAVSFGEWGDFSAGPGSFADEIITLAGGENVAGKADNPWPMYSPEQIVDDDPDIVIIPGDESMRQAFMEFENYSSLRAVKDGSVYCVDANIVSRAGPRLSQAVELVYNILHGEG